MARLPNLNKIEEIVTWHTNKYYQTIGENPEVRQREGDHLKVIAEENERYLVLLKKQLPAQYEEYKERFNDNIDFLTQVFTKKTVREEKESDLQKLKDRLKSK